MSSTFFTASPQWRWFIVTYFFLGGLAGGSYFLATLMARFGAERDRPLVRLGYLAPDITQAILDGRQPPDLSADKLLAHSRLPLAWGEQRTVLGFA